MNGMPSPPVAKISNAELARHLVAYAHTLQGQGANPFKIRAYRRAAQTIRNARQSFSSLLQSGADLTVFPGIGEGIAAALREIVFNGKMGQMEIDLQAMPPELAITADFPGLDPRRVARVLKRFSIDSPSALRAKFESGAIGEAFGPRMEDHFRNAFRTSRQMLLDDADQLAERIRHYLLDRCDVKQAAITGEIRRRTEVVSEVAFVVETNDFPALKRSLAAYSDGVEVSEESDHTVTVQLPGSLPILLTLAASANWGSTLAATTGSKPHLEQFARVGGLSRRSRSEEAVYESVGLSWVPPELREGHGEVELAAHGRLPKLVTVDDICGELHAHSTSSDGVNTIEEMAEAARALGYRYLGITDHSQSLRIARGVSISDLRRQIARIDRLNDRLASFRVLKSAEVDILEDGALDYPSDLLAELDYTICSIHSRFRKNKAEQTERVMRAMDHPSFNILGHATGRLLLHRSGYELDWDRLIPHARERSCVFEINADPDRLDLSWERAREVVAGGIMIAIGTDAHRAAGLGYMHCGVDVARKAGLSADDVLNTHAWAEVRRFLRK